MRRSYALLLVLSFFVVASPAYAEEGLPAGFAPGPVWVSKSTPTAGEKVQIYAAIYNASDTSIEGSITFLVDQVSVGSVPFTLNEGETTLKSVPWTAIAGSHTVDAAVGTAIEKQSKQATAIRNRAAGSVAVVVGAETSKPAALERIDSASDAVSIAIASGSPLVSRVAGTVFDTAEALRKAGETFLTEAAGPVASVATSSTKTHGQVLGAETRENQESDASIADPEPSGGFMQSVAQSLIPVFAYPAIFYPLLFLILLVIFWIVAKRLRNPRRNRRRF